MHNAIRFIKDKTGATAIEYALLATFIAMAIVAVLTTLGPKLSAAFTTVQTDL